jgi:stress responsive alpha/beta barrel protein
MVRHIVLWRVKGETPEQRRAGAEQIKSRLEALNGRIPGLRLLEVGLDFSRTPDSSDLALYSEFDDADALAAYQRHPEHVAVATFVQGLRVERRMVDYDAPAR